MEKAIEDYTEEEIKQMFLELFFWVAENRKEWLMEAIERKKNSEGVLKRSLSHD